MLLRNPKKKGCVIRTQGMAQKLIATGLSSEVHRLLFVTEWHSCGGPSWLQILSVLPARESRESARKSALLASG
jgi:hypothetical protein